MARKTTTPRSFTRDRVKLAGLLLALTLVGGITVTAEGARAAATTLDFEVTPDVYTSYPGVDGVSFPQGIEVYACDPNTCVAAHSGTRAARGQFAGEFARDPFEVGFSAPQATVKLFARYDVNFDPPRNDISATLRAFDAGGAQVDSQTLTFSSDIWQLMTVGDPAVAEITKVVLTGFEGGFQTNFLAVDDLIFEGEPPPPPPEDTAPPDIVIRSPFHDEVRTERSVRVDIRVTDDTGLDTVTGRVRNDADETVATMDFCGSTFSGTCPIAPPSPVVFEAEQSVSLPGAPSGRYFVEIDACDTSSNCSTASRTFRLDVTEEPATEVVIRRIEVNQAAQEQLTRVTGPGTLPVRVGSTVPLIAGKDMLVRVYPVGIDGVHPTYSARLSVSVERRDGRTVRRRIRPNAGPESVAVAEEPAGTDDRNELFTAMRADPARTLNYVIPGTFLRNARAAQLNVRRGARDLTSGARMSFGRPPRIGLNIVHMSGFGVPTAPAGDVDANVVAYLDAAFPVSDVRVLSEREAVLRTRDVDCGDALAFLDDVFGGDDAPVRFFTRAPNVIPTVGIVDTGVFGRTLGCAYVPDDVVRVGGSSVTQTWGDTAAQEVAHSLGLIHAGDSHGESDGGSAEPWPFPHGSIGETNYGVVLEQTVPPGDFDFGRWDLNLVDPCPTTDIVERFPTCTVDEDQLPHGFMSYGSNTADLGPLVTRRGRWVSRVTYNRIHDAIVRDVAPARFTSRAGAAAAQEGPDERIDALLISGTVEADGSVTLDPVLRKKVPTVVMTPEFPNHLDSAGPYSLKLLDASGQVLRERSFDALEFTDHQSHRDVVRLVIPHARRAAEIVIENDGVMVANEHASPNAPEVEITAPSGGEVLASGLATVRWEASDADGDKLHSLVQFSPDGGWSWQGIALVAPGQPPEAEVDVTELISGRYGLFRVVVSDGFNTSADDTDVFFSVNTTASPAASSDAKRTVSLTRITNPTATTGGEDKEEAEQTRHRAVGRVRAPDGPHSCVEGVPVVLKRNGERIREKDTNQRGRVRFRIPHRPGRYKLRAKRETRAQVNCLGALSPTRRHRHKTGA